MVLALTRNEPDEHGRLPIVGFHFQPHRLSVEQRKRRVEVSDEDAKGPQVEPHQHKVPWLLPNGDVEWDVGDRPEDDEAQVRRRLKYAEDRIDALVTVAESKTLLTRAEVEDEVTRSREPVEDEPTRTR